MKKIYTSNYGRKMTDPKAAAISAGPPDGYTGVKYRLLAPSWNLLNAYKDGSIDQEEYSRLYIELIESRDIDPQELVDVIPDGTFLLCFENPKNFCHRHVLAKWLNDNTDATVEEWKNDKDILEDKQSDLVDSLLDF